MFIALSYDVYNSLLFCAFNVDVIVGVEYSYLLIPKDASQNPVAAVPASRVVQLLVELPLGNARHDRFVAKDSRNGQVILVRREHAVYLLFINHLVHLSVLLNLGCFLEQPAFEVFHFVVSDQFVILRHSLSLLFGQGFVQVVSISVDVNINWALFFRNFKALAVKLFDRRVDSGILRQVKADQAFGVAQARHESRQNMNSQASRVQVDSLDVAVVSDQVVETFDD